MKKFTNNIYFIVPLIAGLFSIQAHSEYLIQYPIEASKGGFLPDGSVQFVKPSNEVWVDVEPSYTEWTFNGDYYDCNSYLPAQEEYLKQETFSQEVSGCSLNFTRYRQERQQNPETLSYKNIGPLILENKTEHNLSYSRYINGLDERFTFNYGAGRSYTTFTLVGSYARSNSTIDIGAKVFNEYGHRILTYFYKYGTYDSEGTCEFRIGATAAGGWTPGDVPAGANAFLEKFKYATLYNSNGTVYKKYKLPNSLTPSPDGAYNNLVVPCTDLSRFYTNLNIYSKAVLSIY